jgi:CRISPR-associated protein (TIGR03984 family)
MPEPLRSVFTLQSQLHPLTVNGDPCAWLAAQAKPGMALLAHADDGVIWGLGETGALRFPSAQVLVQAPWRAPTLQMARLFDSDHEVFLWRIDEGCWQARVIKDGAGDQVACIDERQLLWGTNATVNDGVFTRVVEGQQGMVHAFPRMVGASALSPARRPRLHVRHYLTEDVNTGWQRIAYSRLTGVSV